MFNGIRQLKIRQGGTVAVQGLGGLGHLAVQYARKMGYRTVALSSSNAKRDFASKLGATDYVDGSKEDTAEALQKIGGADLIVVTAPNPDIMGPLLNGCAPRGKVLILARKCLSRRLSWVCRLTSIYSCRGDSCQHACDDPERSLSPWLALRSCCRL